MNITLIVISFIRNRIFVILDFPNFLFKNKNTFQSYFSGGIFPHRPTEQFVYEKAEDKMSFFVSGRDMRTGVKSLVEEMRNGIHYLQCPGQ